MDDKGIGLIGGIIAGAAALLAIIGIIGGSLYASDYGLEATVIDKSCTPTSGGLFGGGNGGATSEVTVRTKVWGIEHTVKDFPDQQCHALRAGEDGNFVVYHVRSEHTLLYEREGGPCVWDSEKGLGC